MMIRIRHNFPVPLAILIATLIWVHSPPGVVASDMGASRLVVFPFRVEAPGQRQELEQFSEHATRRVKEAVGLPGQDLTIETEEAVRKLLGGQPAPGTQEEAIRLGNRAEVDFVVFGEVSSSGSQYRLRGVMWDVREDRVMVSSDFRVGNIHGLPAALQVFISGINKRLHGAPSLPFYRAGGSEPGSKGLFHRVHASGGQRRQHTAWCSSPIAGDLRSVDIGDLDGDRKNETVILERNGLTIRRFEAGKLRTLTQFARPPDSYVNADVADLDGDGVAELIVCAVSQNRMYSAIFRYKDRNLAVMAEFPDLILRTIEQSDGKTILVGQRTDVENMFSGEMVRFMVHGSTASPMGRAVLPPGTLLLSYASGRVGRDSTFVQVMLNQDQRLMVFDRENRLLAGDTDELYGVNRRLSLKSDGTGKEITIPGRIVISDTNGDGSNEILLIRHDGSSSVIQDLAWEEGRLKLKWSTVEADGLISDFSIRDFKNDGSRSLVLLLVQSNPLSSLLGASRSTVHAYDVQP